MSQEKNIYVIIKLQMYVLLYKNKHITKKVEMVKKIEGYSYANYLNILSFWCQICLIDLMLFNDK